MKHISILAALVSSALPAFAADLPADAQRVKSLVKQNMNISADSVKKLPVGLYEVVANRNIIYVDKDVKFLVAGHIYDIATQRDLTQQRLDELSTIDTKQLPLQQAIKTVKGNGKRVLYTFSDPYCSYCQRLERTLETLDNVTIYTFVMPLLNSGEMVDRIYCSADPKKAWHEWMLDHKEPAQKTKNCQVDYGNKNAELVEKFGITGAPTMYFADGFRMEGAVSKEEIEAKFATLK